MFKNVPFNETFTKVEKMTTGWSKDTKYHIYTNQNMIINFLFNYFVKQKSEV